MFVLQKFHVTPRNKHGIGLLFAWPKYEDKVRRHGQLLFRILSPPLAKVAPMAGAEAACKQS